MDNTPREKEFTIVPVLKNGKIVDADKREIFKQYGIDSIIRFPKEDFSHLKNLKGFLTHFNLQHTNHRMGEKYLLVLIVKPGFFDGKKQVLPVLSFENAVVAECFEVRNNVSYDELTEKDFEHSFEHIKSVPELKQAIIRRYKQSMPKLSDKEIVSLGVGITKLKVLK